MILPAGIYYPEGYIVELKVCRSISVKSMLEISVSIGNSSRFCDEDTEDDPYVSQLHAHAIF
jgi:hypothetical protein